MESRWRALLSGIYLRRYLRLTRASRAALAGWELPVGASRAGERIEVEHRALLAWLERLVA